MQAQTHLRTATRHPRTLSPTDAVVTTLRGIHEFTVDRLSVAGATLQGHDPLAVGTRVELVLRLPLYPEIRVSGDVVDVRTRDGSTELAIDFVHTDDRTEDHIQSALLSEIERSQSEGRIADIL